MEMDGNEWDGWEMLEIADNSWIWLKLTGNDWTWLEQSDIDKNDWK